MVYQPFKPIVTSSPEFCNMFRLTKTCSPNDNRNKLKSTTAKANYDKQRIKQHHETEVLSKIYALVKILSTFLRKSIRMWIL